MASLLALIFQETDVEALQVVFLVLNILGFAGGARDKPHEQHPAPVVAECQQDCQTAAAQPAKVGSNK
jgi:hypothetical protein